MGKFDKLGYVDVALHTAAFILMFVAIIQHDWFHDKDLHCREGLYSRCCFDVCSQLTRTSEFQHASQFLAPAALVMEAIGGALVAGFLIMDDDTVAPATARLIAQAMAVAAGVLVAILMHSHHESSIDASTYEIDTTYWIWIGGVCASGTELMIQSAHAWNIYKDEYSLMG